MKQKKRIQRRLANKKPRFLAEFRALCSVTEAASRIGIDRSLHYQWLRDDPKYAADFAASLQEARENLVDDAVYLARTGTFEPRYYQGHACFAKRQRVMCRLADGTTGFLDELPKGAKIVERKTVVTADGAQLGTWRREGGLLAKLLSAWIPEFATTVSVATNEEPPPFVVTIQQR